MVPGIQHFLFVIFSTILSVAAAYAQPPEGPPPDRALKGGPNWDEFPPGPRGFGPGEFRGVGRPGFGRAPFGPGSSPAMALLRLLDSDGNRTLSSEELDNAAQALRSLDANSDGQVAFVELALTGRRGRRAEAPETSAESTATSGEDTLADAAVQKHEASENERSKNEAQQANGAQPAKDETSPLQPSKQLRPEGHPRFGGGWNRGRERRFEDFVPPHLRLPGYGERVTRGDGEWGFDRWGRGQQHPGFPAWTHHGPPPGDFGPPHEWRGAPLAGPRPPFSPFHIGPGMWGPPGPPMGPRRAVFAGHSPPWVGVIRMLMADDGKITKEEATEKVDALFALHDTNRDGAIDREELRGAMQKRFAAASERQPADRAESAPEASSKPNAAASENESNS